MINSRILIKLARKWQKMAALKRKRITLPKIKDKYASSKASKTTSKGNFVVYSTDHKRYVFPITYLNKYIFRELLKLSEEEFGLSSDGPIMLPCDAITMDYVVSQILRHPSGEMDKALFTAMAVSRCSLSPSIYQEQSNQHSVICSF